MKTSIFAGLFIMAAMVSCTSKNEKANETDTTATETETTAAADLNGRWYIETISLSDSAAVRPAEQTPDVAQYIEFTDSTYSVSTNCNSMSGCYTLAGDSIKLGDAAMTMMACENMATEDALRQIIPAIETVSFENDSVARLNGAQPDQYIALRKASAE